MSEKLTTGTFPLKRYLDDLGRLVRCESKTGELAALDVCAQTLAEIGDRILGARASMIATDDGPVVQWRLGKPPFRVALVGHYDTVHPLGTLESAPFIRKGDVIRGPGTFDMKAGILTMLYGAAAAGGTSLNGVLIHCCPDEEDGSKSSRAVLRQAVDDGLRVALVYEGAGADGAVYTRRRGGLWIRASFTGRDAHASRPHDGASGLLAMAEFSLHAPRLANPALRTTVVPTVANSGKAINTLPGQASVVIDSRTATAAEQQRVLRGLKTIPSSVPGVRRRIDIIHRFDPLDEKSSTPVYEALVGACAAAGIAVPAATSGDGVSDANHLAGMGVLVLDGLGPEGGLDHSPQEWVRVSSIAGRVQLTETALPAVQQLADAQEPRPLPHRSRPQIRGELTRPGAGGRVAVAGAGSHR